MYDIIVAENSKYFKLWEELFPWARKSSGKPETQNYWFIPENILPLKGFRFPEIQKDDLQFRNIFNSAQGSIELTRLDFLHTKTHDVILDIDKSTKFDAFFLCSNETNWQQNYKKIKSFIPHLQIVRNPNGFYEAHKECSDKSSTFQFWVFDADCYLLENPVLYEPPQFDYQYLHLFYALNPVNGLIYGHGGVKIFNKEHLAKNQMQTDLTLSVGKLKISTVCLSVHAFNTSPYETWRTAFRECCKLFKSKDLESQQRLNQWSSFSLEKTKFEKFSVLGYRDAVQEHLKAEINSETYLKNLFKRKHL
jgi:hypothetical protein